MSSIRKEILLQNLQALKIEQRYELEVLEQVDSTNRWVCDRLNSKPDKMIICTADSQSGGKGRQGRHWISPASGNIYLSFSSALENSSTDISSLSLVAGMAIIRVLTAMGIMGLGIKWPNDILLHGEKLAGVLIEVKIVGEKKYLVIGAGINVQMPDGVEIESATGWADLARTGLAVEHREEIIARLLSETLQLMTEYFEYGFSYFQAEWMELDAWKGMQVDIVDRGEIRCSGVASGVDVNGFLLIQTEGGLVKISSGDVSLRKQNG